MLENWPDRSELKEGAAIGIVADNKGGLWLQHRGNPGIVHYDANGKILSRMAVTFEPPMACVRGPRR